MSNKKNTGSQAKELVLLFYEKTDLRFTNKDIMVAIQNTKRLLGAGYTFEEIRDTIEYCTSNPPSGGIYSFGFIVNQIAKVTTMLKSQGKRIAKTEAITRDIFNDYGLKQKSNKDKIKEVKNETKINIFD